MDIARAIGGGDFVHNTLGLLGTGVRGEVVDTELDLEHPEWAHTPIVHLAGSGGPHGTSVYGIVFAQGLNPRAKGMLPDAQGIFAFQPPLLGGGPTRYQHTAELVDPAGPYRAVFQTTSAGDARTTEYTTIAAEMDDILFIYDLLATQSQSNAGDQNSRPQAWAKNIVSCGGVRHMDTLDRSDDNWSFGASIGPAADGRIKPTFTHFYDNVFTATLGGGYSSGIGGTSVSTPIVAGHFGLVFQMWHEGVFPGFGGGPSVFDDRPHMTTAKALLVNTAFRYDWHVPGPNSDLDRFKQGWGMPDLLKLYAARNRLLIIDESDLLAPFGSRQYLIDVRPEDTELRATLVYADPRGNVGSPQHRINDLSLRATGPLGMSYWGNNGLIDGNWSTAGGSSNTIDTVENVFVEDPEPGQWTIEVIADEINEDSHIESPELDADFALVVVAIGGTTTSISGLAPPLARSQVLIRPNPFNPRATIDFTIAERGRASLGIYDLSGRLVRVLVDGPVESGTGAVVWDGRDLAGHQLPSGTYFYRLRLDGRVLGKPPG
jgi:subtilisin family serine protease